MSASIIDTATTVKEYDEAMTSRAKANGKPVRKRAVPPASLTMWTRSPHRRIVALDRGNRPTVRSHSDAETPEDRRSLTTDDIRAALLVDSEIDHPKSTEHPLVVADWATARACRKLIVKDRDYSLLRIFDTAVSLKPSSFIVILTDMLAATYYRSDARVKSLAGWMRSFGLKADFAGYHTIIDMLGCDEGINGYERQTTEARILVSSRYTGTHSANRVYRSLSAIAALDEQSAACDALMHQRARLSGKANLVHTIIEDIGELTCRVSTPCKLKVGSQLVIAVVSDDIKPYVLSRSASVSSMRISVDGSVLIGVKASHTTNRKLINAFNSRLPIVITTKPFVPFVTGSDPAANRWLTPDKPQPAEAKIQREVPAHIVLAGAPE